MKKYYEDMDRISAIVIYNNTLFENDNHQFALQEALELDKDNLLDLDDNLKSYDYVVSNIDKVADITFNLNKEKQIVCLDVFEDNSNTYLVANSIDVFEDYKECLSLYLDNKSILLGYFENLTDDYFVLKEIM